MKNFWIQGENPIATWTADIKSVTISAKSTVRLVDSVYAAAAQARLLVPKDIDVQAELAKRWERDHVVDFFQAEFLNEVQIGAELSWYDASDRVVSGYITDLGKLLGALEPVPESISEDLRQVGNPVVLLTGGQLRYCGPDMIDRQYQSMQFHLWLHSDIWMPYVVGYAHPACDIDSGTGPVDWHSLKYFDNRELARRHTPRLNQLIAEIARLVREAGGSWQLEVADCDRAYLPWLSDEGVLLDGHTPPLMDSSLGDDWSSRYDWAADHNAVDPDRD